MNFIDLHCHCTDDEFRFLELLEKAKKENVKYISINNYKNLKVFLNVLPKISKEKLKRYKSISIIPSVELPGMFKFTDLDGISYNIEVHILGLGINLKKADLLDEFVKSKYREINQEEELKRLVKIGHEIGLKFSNKDAYLDFEDDKRMYAGRAFMQAVLVNIDANFCKEDEDNKNKLPFELRTNWRAFQNRCVKDKKNPFYLDLATMNPPVEEVLDLIHAMGGKAYLAHPSSYFAKVGSKEEIQTAFDNTVKFTRDFVSTYPTKTDGVEIYHPSYLGNFDVVSEIGEIAKRYKIATSGGTDIHVDKSLGKDETVSSDSMGNGGKISTRMLKKFRFLRRKAEPILKLKDRIVRMQEMEER